MVAYFRSAINLCIVANYELEPFWHHNIKLCIVQEVNMANYELEPFCTII